MMDWNSLINSMINGLFVGMGAAIGTWIVNRHFVRNLEKLEEKIKTTNGGNR
jgi:hypothetical protein